MCVFGLMMFDLELLLALDDELELGRELKLESGESGDRGEYGGCDERKS